MSMPSIIPGFGALVGRQGQPGLPAAPAPAAAAPIPRAQPQAADETRGRVGRWEAFFERPEVTAALLQFGTS